MSSVDVVVTARDEERHLNTCLRSILSQKGVDVRVIVVDDGSVDDTHRIVTSIADRDDRVQILRHHESRGLAAARNTGLAAATGDWVSFVDGDDLLFPGALRHRLDAASTAPSDTVGVYGDWVSVPERTRRSPVGRRPAARPDTWMVPANKRVPFIASAPLLRREVVVAIGGFDPRCVTAEDAEFWQWWLRLRGRTSYVRRLCVAYRRRAGSMTRRDLSAHFRANREAFESLDRRLGPDAPPGVLAQSDADYRTESAHQPRALLAAAVALAGGREADARDVLDELDPIVLRIVGPSVAASTAVATARRRIHGTAGARATLASLQRSGPAFLELVEGRAAAAPTTPELVEAAEWLRAARNLPEHSTDP